MSLKYLGVGLSKTGTTSLWMAMTRLGFKSIQSTYKEAARLNDVVLGTDNRPDFRPIYDDCDFICDLPHAYFFREIGQAYPRLKFILTLRDEDAWYRSMRAHFRKRAKRDYFNMVLHGIVYGGNDFDKLPEFLYKKRFRDWNDTINRVIPPDKLLVMNICDGKDDYATLCPFVERPNPNEGFPHENKT